MSTDTKCRNCGAVLDVGGKRRVICPYCGTSNVYEKAALKPGMIVCAQCGNENPQQHEHCSECGADLYYVCPECGTRNTAEAVHCIKCGANIAQAIKNWQILQAQEQARLEEQKRKRQRTTKAILIPIMCLIGLFLVVALVIGIIEQKQEKEWHVAQTATAEYVYAVSPYKWESEDGKVAVMLEPEFNDVEHGMFLWFYFYNRTDKTCIVDLTEILAADDLGNDYLPSDWIGNDDEYEIEGGQTRHPDIVLEPWITEGATELMFYLPEFCGYSGGTIFVNLTAEDIVFD